MHQPRFNVWWIVCYKGVRSLHKWCCVQQNMGGAFRAFESSAHGSTASRAYSQASKMSIWSEGSEAPRSHNWRRATTSWFWEAWCNPELPRPVTKSQVNSFIVLASYYCKSFDSNITLPPNINPAASIRMRTLCPKDLPMPKPFKGGTNVTRMSQQSKLTWLRTHYNWTITILIWCHMAVCSLYI